MSQVSTSHLNIASIMLDMREFEARKVAYLCRGSGSAALAVCCQNRVDRDHLAMSCCLTKGT